MRIPAREKENGGGWDDGLGGLMIRPLYKWLTPRKDASEAGWVFGRWRRRIRIDVAHMPSAVQMGSHQKEKRVRVYLLRRI